MTTNFTQLGYNHGKLSQQYQPVPFPLPTVCKDCTEQELLQFWVGFDKGWTDSEASSVLFEKQELINANACNY